MTASAEDWLVAAAERGAILAFPTSSTLTPGLVTGVRFLTSGAALALTRGPPMHSDPHVAAAVRFARALALARDFKLARFAAAANARVNALSDAHARLVLLTETALALSA
jgi:hypothetical protein